MGYHIPPSDYDVAALKGKERVKRALEELEAGVGSLVDCVAKETSEGETSFVDIRVSIEIKTGGESQGFTFADILQRAGLLSEIL